MIGAAGDGAGTVAGPKKLAPGGRTRVVEGSLRPPAGDKPGGAVVGGPPPVRDPNGRVGSVPTAVNCTVPFGATVVGFGETTSVSNLPGSVLSFLHAVADTPANARAMIIRAARARVMCVRTFGLFLNDFIELS